MGYTSYDDKTSARTTSYLRSHKAAGTDPFVFTASIASGAVAASIHELLDPKKKNKAGVIIRESRDSDAHPDSRAVAVLFDETGSMGEVPRTFIEKLNGLMALLIKKGYLANPHIMFGAIGDATTNLGEVAPCQIGQFEGGEEAVSALTHVYIEHGGGGQKTESYELACYFLEKYAAMDCLEKRGQKGFLFLIGDEQPYPFVKKEEVVRVIGDSIQSDILFSARDPRASAKRAAKDGATGDLLAALMEKFEVFWIMPGGSASYWNDREVNETLKAIFGQRFLKMQEPENVCELIATTIALEEGFELDAIGKDLRDVGSSAAAVDSATNALVKYAASRSVTKGATVTGGALAPVGADSAARI